MVGGQLVQDVDQYNRHCERSHSFKPVDARPNADIESRWDDDWRHKYANGIDQFVKLSDTGDGVEPQVNDADHGENSGWGRLEHRYAHHSVSGSRGGGEYVRLLHELSAAS